jgi:hypothetical protein
MVTFEFIFIEALPCFYSLFFFQSCLLSVCHHTFKLSLVGIVSNNGGDQAPKVTMFA